MSEVKPEIPEAVDVLIIGGGPSGSAAAATLLQAGLRVCVVEKQSFPRFVIGESLLPRCMDLLEQTGLLEAVEARGYLRKDGAVFLRGEQRRTFLFGEGHSEGWPYTFQVPRGDFDHTLLQAVAAAGVHLLQGYEVFEVATGASPWVRVRGPEGESARIDARFVIDASGYARVLPRLLGLDRPSHLARRECLFTWVESDQREPGAAAGRTWVTVHPGGAWIWLIPFADGRTSVGVVARPDFFADLPSDPSLRLRAILAGEPNAAARVGEADFVFEPRHIPGYSIGVERLHGPGYCLVGNTMEFLDPVFSAGVTLAFESACLAGGLVARQLAGGEVDWDRAYSAPIQHAVGVFTAFIDAWYEGGFRRMLFTEDPPPRIQQQITSVLAGYVFDESNPFVSGPERRLGVLARAVEGRPAPAL